MVYVTERARATFKETLEHMVDRPGVMLRIGPTGSGLGVFPDTLKHDDDQVIEHQGRATLVIGRDVSERLADTTIDVEEQADGIHFVIRPPTHADEDGKA
jgi:Fe-S cluster assembly iron-binding protein IscA